MELKSLIEITRPHNCLMGGLTCIVGVLAANRTYSLNLEYLPPSTFLSAFPMLFPSRLIETLFLTYLTYVFIAAAGNTINDIYDVKVDKINKPNRPLPRGALTLRQAKVLTVALWLIGGLLAFMTSLVAGFIALVLAALGYAYAAKVKTLGAVGNFAVASSFSFGMFYGAVVATESRKYFVFLSGDSLFFLPLIIWVYYLTATFVLFGREVIKGIEDLPGDKLRSVRTIARVHGVRIAAIIAAISNTLGIFFFSISWFMDQMKVVTLPIVIAGDSAVLASSIIILRRYEKPREQGMASLSDKIGGFCGLMEFLLVNIL
nr:geranylgeranylglycerol-phosphate geranylgeranyltransferase [Candidatus Njordarchaeum guaymaensis]